jgi:hypothetical protein
MASSFIQPSGYTGWGKPLPGYPGVIPAPTPTSTPTPTLVKVALMCHGESDHYAFSNPFIVPTHIRVNFFYDPRSEDTTMCFNTSDLPKICAMTPKLVYPPGTLCPNLKLSRADDIDKPTGFYSCDSGGMVPATSLGPTEVHDPPLDTYVSYLSKVINDLETEQGASGEIYDVYVLACGVTTRYKLHPSRMTAILLHNGTSIRQNLFEQAYATAAAQPDLTAAQKEEYLWKEIRRLQQGGRRRKTRSSQRKKRKTRRR